MKRKEGLEREEESPNEVWLAWNMHGDGKLVGQKAFLSREDAEKANRNVAGQDYDPAYFAEIKMPISGVEAEQAGSLFVVYEPGEGGGDVKGVFASKNLARDKFAEKLEGHEYFIKEIELAEEDEE